jgi:hypothetical protein
MWSGGAGRQNGIAESGTEPLSTEPLSKIDDLRDNWWCASIGTNPGPGNYGEYEVGEYGEKAADQGVKDPDAGFPYPEFLTPAQRTDAA